MPKSSQSRESDFLKMSVSPRRRAHFERSGQARPGQKGLAKPSQARPGLLRPRGGGQGRPKGGQGEAKGGQSEAKGRPREAKRRLRGGQGGQKGGQGAAKGGQGEAKGRPKRGQDRESDFLKMSVSPRRRAHFERSDHARPDQKGLAKPSQARPNF